jgi:rhodanese-related sulfurtransferase
MRSRAMRHPQHGPRCSMTRPARTAACLALGLGVLAAGCGSDDESMSNATAEGKEQQTTATAPATQAFARLEPSAFADRMKESDAVLINVHIPYEGELEQTDAFIPYDKIVGDARLPKDKNSEVLLYCRSGRMSEEAGAALHTQGYTNVAHLEGGMKAWESAGRTLIQNPAHATSDGGMAPH